MGEGGPGKARDGCGAVGEREPIQPLFRPWGATFPPGEGREKIFFKKGLILERFSVIILDCMKYRREEV